MSQIQERDPRSTMSSAASAGPRPHEADRRGVLMFTLSIVDPDAKDDPVPQDVITLGAETDVCRAFMTLTDMYVKRYGKLNKGQPYPDLLMLPPYHMADVVFTLDEFRQIQAQARDFLAQENLRDDDVRDVLKTLIQAPLPIWSAGRKDADARGEGRRATILTISPWALRGHNDDPWDFKDTYFMYCPDCGLVKVGGSKNPKGRLGPVQREHQEECRRLFRGPTQSKLRLLGTFPGNQQATFRRHKFPGLYARREWLIYKPRVQRFLSRAIAAGLAAPGPKDLPAVPDWTLSRERRVFKHRRNRERVRLAEVLCAAQKGRHELAMLYRKHADRLLPWPRLNAMP
jgi:hypothetical protein